MEDRSFFLRSREMGGQGTYIRDAEIIIDDRGRTKPSGGSKCSTFSFGHVDMHLMYIHPNLLQTKHFPAFNFCFVSRAFSSPVRLADRCCALGGWPWLLGLPLCLPPSPSALHFSSLLLLLALYFSRTRHLTLRSDRVFFFARVTRYLAINSCALQSLARSLRYLEPKMPPVMRRLQLH